MVFKRSKLRRFSIGLLLTISLIVVGLVTRINTSLPYLDRARISHFFYNQAWSNLADELWAEPQLDGVQLVVSDDGFEIERFGGEVEVYAYDLDIDDGAEIEISRERQARYVELFDAARFFLHMDRREDRVITDGGGGERFGRSFFSIFISPRDGYRYAEECDGQYWQADEGFCQVRLGENWLIGYSWMLPIDEHWAKCSGIWSEYDDSQIIQQIPESSRMGTAEHYGWAVENLGETNAERWAARGREQMRAALSDGEADAVDTVLFSCSYL